MSRFFPTLLLLCSFLSAAAGLNAAAGDRVMRLADRQALTLPRLAVEAGEARVIYLAENHTDIWHHDLQLQLINGFRGTGKPLAICLEMFTSGSQATLDRWNSGKLSVADLRTLFERDWTVPWSYYRDIFLYARRHRIPLVGLNLPREISRKVASQGFASLTPKERQLLPPGITCNVSPAYMTFIRQAYVGHSMGEQAFTNFCEAQLLWNRHMATTLQHYATSHPRTTLLVLVGVGHALRPGIPAETGIAQTDYRVILPELAGLNRNNLTANDADYLVLAPAAGH